MTGEYPAPHNQSEFNQAETEVKRTALESLDPADFDTVAELADHIQIYLGQEVESSSLDLNELLTSLYALDKFLYTPEFTGSKEPVAVIANELINKIPEEIRPIAIAVAKKAGEMTRKRIGAELVFYQLKQGVRDGTVRSIQEIRAALSEMGDYELFDGMTAEDASEIIQTVETTVMSKAGEGQPTSKDEVIGMLKEKGLRGRVSNLVAGFIAVNAHRELRAILNPYAK